MRSTNYLITSLGWICGKTHYAAKGWSSAWPQSNYVVASGYRLRAWFLRPISRLVESYDKTNWNFQVISRDDVNEIVSSTLEEDIKTIRKEGIEYIYNVLYSGYSNVMNSDHEDNHLRQVANELHAKVNVLRRVLALIAKSEQSKLNLMMVRLFDKENILSENRRYNGTLLNIFNQLDKNIIGIQQLKAEVVAMLKSGKEMNYPLLIQNSKLLQKLLIKKKTTLFLHWKNLLILPMKKRL